MNIRYIVISLLCFYTGIYASSPLENYITEFDTIEGWFEKPFLNILKAINNYQIEHNITGNVGEIGVYHGKSLIPLCLLSQDNELTLAVDCFDDQQYNYDLSGMGCQFSKFSHNIQKYCVDCASRIVIHKCDSSKAAAQEYLDKVNGKKFRLFSIDGCHRAKETFIDLKNAYAIIEEGGVIIIDDYFNKDWPGVSDGVSRYMYKNLNLRPFFIGWNKILLAHVNYKDIYFNYIKTLTKPKKEATIFNTRVLIYE